MDDEKVNILLVDDLEEKLLVYDTILGTLDQNLVKARSGREALRHLLNREFAVILLDVHMPDMDGLETAAMIRSRRQTAHTPIIFVTAFSDEIHTAQGYSLGAVDYILTPIIPEILRTKVGVFVDLFKKTQQVRRQAEERVALARAQAARAAAEEATRRSAFLAEAGNVLVRSLDSETIARSLARHAVPFLGDLCAVALVGEGPEFPWRTELAWIEQAAEASTFTASTSGLDLGPLTGLVQQVLETGEWQSFPVTMGGECPPGWHRLPAEHEGDKATWEIPGTRVVPHAAVAAPLCARGTCLGAIVAVLGGNGCGFDPHQVGLVLDLADRAAMAIDNAQLYRDVQENDRRKNEFLAILAHELRNPLAPIRNAAQILRMLEIPDQSLLWASDVIGRQVEHLVRLVDDLLDISRIAGGRIQLRFETVDVAVAVERAVETSRPLIDTQGHQLTVTLPAHPILVRADLVRLSQVLSNLLNNAAKYTEPGGRISLAVAQEGDNAVFQVVDNGIGLAPEMIPHIFEIFTQVDRSIERSQGGLGIGLNLVRHLVQMHGGTVAVRSEGPNCGSEFVVRLPTIDEPADSLAPAPASPFQASHGLPGPHDHRPTQTSPRPQL